MLISKSTTADLLKIINKLEEFFSQQFKSSKKLFSSLEPWDKTTTSNKNSAVAGSGGGGANKNSAVAGSGGG